MAVKRVAAAFLEELTDHRLGQLLQEEHVALDLIPGVLAVHIALDLHAVAVRDAMAATILPYSFKNLGGPCPLPESCHRNMPVPSGLFRYAMVLVIMLT